MHGVVGAGVHFNLRRTHEGMATEQSNAGRHRGHYYRLGALAPLFLVGCTSLKKAGLIGAGALVPGAIASVATSGTAPVLLASTVGASATSVVADVMTPSKKGGAMATASNCAPDNFWSLLGSLIETGGLLLLGVILVPMILGWILPGPLERKKKK